MAKVKFGTMICPTPTCGHQVNVKINENETLSCYCDECEGSDYARKEQGKHAAWLTVIKRIDAKPAAPAPVASSKSPFTPS